MITAIRFKDNFRNFKDGDVIPVFNNGTNFFADPYNRESSNFFKLIYDHLTTGNTGIIETKRTKKFKTVYYFSFAENEPNLYSHNAPQKIVDKLMYYFNSGDFESIYSSIRNNLSEFADSYILFDGFNRFTSDFDRQRFIWASGGNGLVYGGAVNNPQLFLSGSCGFGSSCYTYHSVYCMQAKAWLCSSALTRNPVSYWDKFKETRETGFVVKINGIKTFAYPYNTNTPSGDLGLSVYLESASTLAGSPDTAKIYSTETNAKKSADLFIKSYSANPYGVNLRKELKGRYTWIRSITSDKATYEIIPLDEFKNRIFEGKF